MRVGKGSESSQSPNAICIEPALRVLAILKGRETVSNQLIVKLVIVLRRKSSGFNGRVKWVDLFFIEDPRRASLSNER